MSSIFKLTKFKVKNSFKVPVLQVDRYTSNKYFNYCIRNFCDNPAKTNKDNTTNINKSSSDNTGTQSQTKVNDQANLKKPALKLHRNAYRNSDNNLMKDNINQPGKIESNSITLKNNKGSLNSDSSSNSLNKTISKPVNLLNKEKVQVLNSNKPKLNNDKLNLGKNQGSTSIESNTNNTNSLNKEIQPNTKVTLNTKKQKPIAEGTVIKSNITQKTQIKKSHLKISEEKFFNNNNKESNYYTNDMLNYFSQLSNNMNLIQSKSRLNKQFDKINENISYLNGNALKTDLDEALTTTRTYITNEISSRTPEQEEEYTSHLLQPSSINKALEYYNKLINDNENNIYSIFSIDNSNSNSPKEKSNKKDSKKDISNYTISSAFFKLQDEANFNFCLETLILHKEYTKVN